MNGGKFTISAVPHKSSCPTLLSGDAASAAALLEEPDKPIWYLGYGSNLNSNVFKGKRKIKPLEERHVLVEGLELTFDLPGLPYLEPRFANCRFTTSTLSNGSTEPRNDEKDPNYVERRCDFDFNAPWTGKGALIGVAYLISAEDFARVIKSEGGGSGYKMVSVQAKVFRRKVKPGSGEERFELTGETVNAFTLLASDETIRKPFGQPSKRYLTLIQQGAKGERACTDFILRLNFDFVEHKLPPNYIAYLDSLTPYFAGTFRQELGAAVFIALCGIPLTVIMMFGLTFAHKDGSYPRWVNESRRKLARLIWRIYDDYMTGMFGDGERTIKKDA